MGAIITAAIAAFGMISLAPSMLSSLSGMMVGGHQAQQVKAEAQLRRIREVK